MTRTGITTLQHEREESQIELVSLGSKQRIRYISAYDTTLLWAHAARGVCRHVNAAAATGIAWLDDPDEPIGTRTKCEQQLRKMQAPAQPPHKCFSALYQSSPDVSSLYMHVRDESNKIPCTPFQAKHVPNTRAETACDKVLHCALCTEH